MHHKTSRQKVDPMHLLSVGDVAKRSGVAISTLHYYESKGLISSLRTEGNQRRYTSSVLRYIAIIKVAQRAGISLDEIKEVLGDYKPEVRVTASQWKAAAGVWHASLDERIMKMKRLRDELDVCIGCGCLSLDDCPLRNPDDELFAHGPGAHILERDTRAPRD